MKCGNPECGYSDDSMIVSTEVLYFSHECVECGWRHLVWRDVLDARELMDSAPVPTRGAGEVY